MNEIIITNHAYDMAKRRIGWNKSALEKMSSKAYVEGITHSQTKGRLKRFLDSKFLSYRKATNMRIYGEVLFIFVGNKLITLYTLTNELKKLVRVM